MLAAACAAEPVATVQPTPTPPRPTPLPATATPVPIVLLIDIDGHEAVAAEVRAWAEAHGYVLETLSSSRETDRPAVHAVAWVSVNEMPAWAADPGASLAIPGVVVDPVAAEASQTVSVVGGPGSRYDQAGFVPGVIAGLASRTGVVGLVDEMGGARDRVMAQGFVQGVRYICARCQIVRQAAGEATAQRLSATLTDVLFVVPGPDYEGVWQRLAAARVGAVWVGKAPEAVGQERWVGGVVFAPETLIRPALEALFAGEPGKAWPYSVAQGGLRLEGGVASLSPGRRRLLEQAWQALADGSLDTGLDPVSGELR